MAAVRYITSAALFFTFMFFTVSCVPLSEADLNDDPYTESAFDEGGFPQWFYFDPITSHLRYVRCNDFFDRTVDERRALLLKQFDYFEAARKPDGVARALDIEVEIRDMLDDLYIKAPPGCMPERRFR